MTSAVLFQFMPPLLPSEYQRLTESIRAHGVQVPVLVDEDGAIIDGHHRDMIASELGIECPRDVRTGLTDAEKRTLAISLNKDRRHLTREQVRALMAESLKADPQLSDREHARRVGVSDKTVAGVRADLVATAEIPQFTKTIGGDGKSRPATRTAPERIDPATGEVLDPKETPKEPTMTAAPSRLAMPQPKRHGGGTRPKHAQIIGNAVATIRGACAALDFEVLDGSISNEEAARLADDLSDITRSIKRIQSLLKKEA